MGLIDSSAGGSFLGFQLVKSVWTSGLVSAGGAGSMKSCSLLWSTGVYARSGGVGDRRDNFGLRCRDLRERIDPAHDFTFFLFLLGFLVIDDLLELQGSLD